MKTIFQTICICALTLAMCFADFQPDKQPHSCAFGECPYEGKTEYKHSHGETYETVDDIGSDCDAIDSIHFQHPSWSYDECQNYLFASENQFVL